MNLGLLLETKLKFHVAAGCLWGMLPEFVPFGGTVWIRRVRAARAMAWFGLVVALVRPLPAAETWVKVTADRFTVLSPAGEAVARKWVRELSRFGHGLQQAVPVSPEVLPPLTVVLFPSNLSMDPFLPREEGRPARLGGLFAQVSDFNIIMLNLARDEREIRRLLFHEVVHWHLANRGAAMPLWLGEGLAEYYSTFEVGDAQDFSFGAPLAGHLRWLATSSWLPLTELTGIERGSLLFNEGTRTGIFYAEAWALVHFLMLGAEARGMSGIEAYLDRLQANEPEPEAFRAAFGGSHSDLEARLQKHLRERTSRRQSFSGVKALESPDISAASALEVALAKAVLTHASRDLVSAEAAARQVIALDSREARAWQLLGLVLAGRAKQQADSGLFDEAAASFRRAIQLEPRRLASFEGLAGIAFGMATFEPGDRALLERGLALEPGNTLIEAGLATQELRSGSRANGVAALQRILAADPGRREPGTQYAGRILQNDSYRRDLAEVATLVGESRFAEGLAILDRLIDQDLDPANRKTAQGLRATLNAVIGAVARPSP